MPYDLPHWPVVYQHTQCRLKAKVIESLTSGLRKILRIADRWQVMPTAVIFDSWALQSTVESRGRACYDDVKRRKGNKVHLAC